MPALSSGMLPCPSSAPVPSDAPGLPSKWRLPPIQGAPKPILYAHRAQVISTRQNVQNTIIMVLTAHFFCTRPPYKTARPGMLMRPTSVAAVICQAVSPDDSQFAQGSTTLRRRGPTLKVLAVGIGSRSQPGHDGLLKPLPRYHRSVIRGYSP